MAWKLTGPIKGPVLVLLVAALLLLIALGWVGCVLVTQKKVGAERQYYHDAVQLVFLVSRMKEERGGHDGEADERRKTYVSAWARVFGKAAETKDPEFESWNRDEKGQWAFFRADVRAGLGEIRQIAVATNDRLFGRGEYVLVARTRVNDQIEPNAAAFAYSSANPTQVYRRAGTPNETANALVRELAEAFEERGSGSFEQMGWEVAYRVQLATLQVKRLAGEK